VHKADLTDKVARYLLAASLSLMLSACQLINFNTGFQPDELVERRMLPAGHVRPETDLLAMTPEMIDYLNTHVDADLYGWSLVSRLQDLLFSESYLNMQYDDAAHFTASEAFTSGRANCLSLMNLYIAMARYKGLSVQYQTVQVRPTWNRRGELLVLSEHINALGRLGGSERYIVDFTPEIRLQQGTAKLISDRQALALYYNNIAVAHLLEDELDDALQYFRHALDADPELAIAWNNMGGVWNRLGDKELAEYSYHKAAWIDRNNASALNNLARFYYMQGDFDKSTRYARAVESYNRRNPYYHYALGNTAYEDERYQDALKHFRDAVRRYDLEPDFYLAMGMTQKQLGEEQLSEELVKVAIALRELGDQTYRTGLARVRRVDNRTILRSTSAGFTIRVAND
jgi:tetratricopeptide (TPR) repeat protein